jgi:hypothetical protein
LICAAVAAAVYTSSLPSFAQRCLHSFQSNHGSTIIVNESL